MGPRQKEEAEEASNKDNNHIPVTDESPPEKAERPANPLLSASLLSQWFFSWSWPLLALGSTRPLQEEDLPQVCPADSSHSNLTVMRNLLDNLDDKTSLFRLLVRHHLTSTKEASVLMVTSMLARLLQALALQVLLNQFESRNSTTNTAKQAYAAAAVMTVCGAVTFITKQRQFFLTYRMGMQFRIGLIAAIYRKSFALPSVNSVSAGQVTNLASNDVERFLMASVTGPYILFGPIEALFVLAIGISQLGMAFCAGFALFMLFLLPLQFALSQKFATLRHQVATNTDARVNLVSQAISGARVMKMNAWEFQLERRIAESRAKEVQTIVQSCRYKGWNEAIYFISGLVVSLVIFLVHVLTGGTLTSGMVFSTLTLVNILQHTMTKVFPLAIMNVSECYVSSKRIEEFLKLRELHIQPYIPTNEAPTAAGSVSTNPQEETPLIALHNVTCHWNTIYETDNAEEPVVALDKISAVFRPNCLYGIMGVVGSGKSAFLQSLVGELPITTGELTRRYTSLAYASQDPWILNGSVRENIIMQHPFDETWYQEVRTACALQEDIRRFAHGDATLLGDKGVQCSGGQRARIGLCRALYRDAQVLILDDPMSAVDTKVGRWIYENAILGLAIKRGKCVILASHQLHFLNQATECFLIDAGKISCRGSYADCIEAAHGAPLNATPVVTETGTDTDTGDHAMVDETPSPEADGTLAFSLSSPKTGASKIELKEDRRTGIVQLSTWIDYANAMGGLWVAGLIAFLFASAQTLSLLSMVAIGKWSEQAPDIQDSTNSLSIVIGTIALTTFVAIDRALLTFYFFNKASQRLHDKMARSVLLSRISFFDTNPSGRILNRFSADVGIADEQLPLTLFDCLVGLTMAAGSAVTAIVVLPVILLSLPPLTWYFVKMRNVFVATTRELKRLEGLGRSPIFEMIGETLNGIATIRANNGSDYFLQKFEKVHDGHTRAYFCFVGASRWFATRLEYVTFCLMALGSFSAALFYDQEWFNLEPAVIGLALTLLLQLAGTNFPWMVRQSAEVVNQMVSVERLSAYADLPSESPTATAIDEKYTNWPNDPSIFFDAVTVRYQAHLPPALRGVTVEIKGGEKIGIVGRTGSGKSSLVQALFRLLEAEEGAIYIDGVDISTLGLHRLRLAMSVIPQVPILFRGCTVRENLDPFGSYADSQIWEVLEDVQMSKVVRDLYGGLQAMVSDGGSNFSVGQRQLLCLARAVLRKSSILVLDEATANVDKATEDSLKVAIARNFAEATILAVAHRLDTVMDYDRILVLGDGRVLEFGSPSDLREKESGHFASLVASQTKY